MEKYITFDVEENTARTSAEFWANGVMKNRKYLTRVEEEALEPIFEEFPCDVDAGWMFKALEDGVYFFDNDGEMTHFEEMVYELVKGEQLNMKLIDLLESIIAQDYITVFDNDGNTHAISKKAFIQLVKENN